MTDSHDPISRLIDADPARTSPQGYPAADPLVRRALASVARPRIGVAFRAKVASAVLGASLVTGAGITALQESAPTLPVLALSSSPTTTNASDSKIAGSMLRPAYLQDFRFDGSDLNSLPGTASVWKVTPPNDLREFLQIAKALGLEGEVQQHNIGPDQSTAEDTYSISDPNHGTLTYSLWSGSGLGSWWFSKDSSDTSSVSSHHGTAMQNSPTEADYAQWAQEFVNSLGLEYQIGRPDIYLYDSPDVQTSGASVSFTVILDGLKTNIGLYVSLDSTGRVTSASGSLGSFERVGNYPLSGVAEGVAQLQQQNDASVKSEAVPTTTEPSPSGSSAPSSSDGTMNEVMPTNPTVVAVRLSTVETQLQLATVNGEWYLVPYYVFSGNATAQGDNAGEWDGSWTVVAVSSEYVTLDQPTVMPMAAK